MITTGVDTTINTCILICVWIFYWMYFFKKADGDLGVGISVYKIMPPLVTIKQVVFQFEYHFLFSFWLMALIRTLTTMLKRIDDNEVPDLREKSFNITPFSLMLALGWQT